MTPRADRKLIEVPLARYSYRHEAEFAAGFLEDAGIPYRLQLDDPAMGMSVGMDATIWVLGLDEARAREVLEHGIEPLDEGDDVFDVVAPRTPGPAGRFPAGPPLGVRERLLLLASSGACGAAGLFLPSASFPIVGPALLVVAALLALAGILGWVPEPVRRVLRALSGHAP